jgi:hypothetical protein
MPVLRRLLAAAAWLPFIFVVSAGASTADVIAATYSGYSMTPPTLESVFICHGYGCQRRTEVGLTAAERAKLTQMLASGKASPAAERKAVGTAGAWFDKRIAPAAGTQNHIARSGYRLNNDPSQFDCIDSSRNTTSLLLVLDQLKLLRHHRVDPPVARGYFLDFHLPHVTAILTEKASGESWSVDSWTRAYGEAPEIMRLSVWKTLD